MWSIQHDSLLFAAAARVHQFVLLPSEKCGCSFTASSIVSQTPLQESKCMEADKLSPHQVQEDLFNWISARTFLCQFVRLNDIWCTAYLLRKLETMPILLSKILFVRKHKYLFLVPDSLVWIFIFIQVQIDWDFYCGTTISRVCRERPPQMKENLCSFVGKNTSRVSADKRIKLVGDDRKTHEFKQTLITTKEHPLWLYHNFKSAKSRFVTYLTLASCTKWNGQWVPSNFFCL